MAVLSWCRARPCAACGATGGAASTEMVVVRPNPSQTTRSRPGVVGGHSHRARLLPNGRPSLTSRRISCHLSSLPVATPLAPPFTGARRRSSQLAATSSAPALDQQVRSKSASVECDDLPWREKPGLDQD
jgi:hypothetical protein